MDGRMGGGLYKTIRRFFSKNLQKYKQSCTQLLKLDKKEARDIIDTMETILCDADGEELPVSVYPHSLNYKCLHIS